MICSKCGNDKDKSEFYKKQSRCKECSKITVREYARLHKEERSKYQKEYLARPEAREIRRKQAKEYRIKHREELNKKQCTYRNDNIYKIWANSSIHNHKCKNKYIISITKEELIKIAEKTKKCPICGIELKWIYGRGHALSDSPTLDRINNENEIRKDNIQIICAACNTTKLHRTLEEMDIWVQKWVEYRKRT